METRGGSAGGIAITYYRLPDHTYRALVERGGTSLLEPSNMVEIVNTDHPAEYGRWTLEELQSLEGYGDGFTKLMEAHREGRFAKESNVIIDLD